MDTAASPPIHGLLFRLARFGAQVIATELAACAMWVTVDLWRHRKDFT